MRQVLIWKKALPGGEYDIFNSTNYGTLYDHVQTVWAGNTQNWGNKLWFQGIYSAIDTGENEYSFISETVDPDVINNSFDFIILPMANIFFVDFLDSMLLLTAILEKIQIPVFVVACGVQADSYDALDNVIASIGKDSARFIRAVYNTGGEFALRGYFTKEFFDRLGFHSAVVTGCPSMYQLGPDFQIDNLKRNICDLHPVFNGQVKSVAKLMHKYPQSVFIDQDQYFYPLFQPNYLDKTNIKKQLNFSDTYSIDAAKFLSDSRILQFADMNDWWNYLRQEMFNYAFGSRIHGTIMSLLSGIPATIVAMDSRTREMAEFFDIPRITADRKKVFSLEEFHESFLRMDYTAFNSNFCARFKAYEKFLVEHGIVSHVNTNNKFFSPQKDISFDFPNKVRKEEFSLLYAQMQKNQVLLKGMRTMRHIKGKLSL